MHRQTEGEITGGPSALPALLPVLTGLGRPPREESSLELGSLLRLALRVQMTTLVEIHRVLARHRRVGDILELACTLIIATAAQRAQCQQGAEQGEARDE